MKKSIIPTILLVLALALSGCSSTSTLNSPEINSTASSSTNSASPSNGIVGFGATLETWNDHHIADQSGNFAPGCCYDLDPNLKSWGGTFRYTDVTVSNGIVTGYVLNLPENTKLNDAKISALAEMPKDSQITFFTVQKKSATLEVTSAILKPILMDPSLGSADGAVDFVFCSMDNKGTSSFNTANINVVWVTWGMGLATAKEAVC